MVKYALKLVTDVRACIHIQGIFLCILGISPYKFNIFFSINYGFDFKTYYFHNSTGKVKIITVNIFKLQYNSN